MVFMRPKHFFLWKKNIPFPHLKGYKLGVPRQVSIEHLNQNKYLKNIQ